MKQPAIRTKGLTTGYIIGRDRKSVTVGLDASLYSGTLVCLLGPNGAGKSTLLRTLAGFQKPLGGDIDIFGKSLRNYSPKELARTLSVVLTEKPLLENMDVETLISMGRAPYTGFWGRLDDTDRQAVNEAIKLIGIEPLRNRMVQTLSDGERQKVMIAKSLAQETSIIFLDEPMAFLDYPSKVEIMLLLHSLAQKFDKTIFMSTHDLDLVLQIADIIWLVDRNRGFCTGSPRELAENGQLEKYFLRTGILFDHKELRFKVDI